MSIEGGKFLDQKYKDLTGSPEVKRAVVATQSDTKRPEETKHYPDREFIPHTRDERIEAYLDRLDYVIKDERGWRRLRQKLVNEFTIDVNDGDTLLKIANGLYESEKRIAIEQGRGTDIKELESKHDILTEYKSAIFEKRDIQERTLSSWLDYLKQNDAQYPTWFRYFVVRNLEKMGTLNKEKGEYSKRNDYTIAPFPELNSEALGFVYRMLTTGVGHQEFTDEPEKRDELTTLIEKKDFIKLYTFAQIETAGAPNREHIEGEWVKYDQGSDHHALENALRGKGTGWCTAEGSAYSHLEHGDFYVYYSRGTKGAYSEPRIAIRMEGDSIAEVRGVNHRQELEPALVDIATEKYHALPGGEKFDKKSLDMKRMTELTKKQETNQPLTKDDLRFLYEVDTEIEGFGYDRDPRIDELLETRYRKADITTLADCAPEHLSTSFTELSLTTEVYVEDTGTTLRFCDFREEQHQSKLPQLIELAQRLKETGSLAIPDLSFEGGSVSIEITPTLREQLKDWDTAKIAYEKADNSSPSWIYDELKNIPWKQPTASSLDILVLNHGKTTPQDRDVLVTQMDNAGYRPLTLAELIALGITRPELNKRDEILNTYEKHTLAGVSQAPFLDFVGGRRDLRAYDASDDWGDWSRFLFVRK